MQDNCVTPHCDCTVPFLKVEMDCSLCQSSIMPEDEANVQFLLDGMGATLCKFLGVSNPVFQIR